MFLKNRRLARLDRGKRKHLLLYLASTLLLLAGIAIFYFWNQKAAPRIAGEENLHPTSGGSPRIEALRVPPDRILQGKIAPGQTLSSALRAQGLPATLVAELCRHLNPLVNLRKLQPGDSFEVRLSPSGDFREFRFASGPLNVYQITVTPTGEWVGWRKEIPVDKYWACVKGEIQTSLFDAIEESGEQDQLILDYADIFAWEIDFNSDPQPGDRFQMIVEKYYRGETFVQYGRILFAEYTTPSRSLRAFYFSTPDGGKGYFTPDGQSLRKALLRSPLKFTRISSGYSHSRRHPILGGNRPHYGVDYAAPPGSPVWAIADGKVIFCGWNGGYGKQIILRHANGYESMYGHLSRFAPGVQKGKAVRQKQVIGYVGSTGLSTGPHLDFRLSKNKVFRNPLRETSPRAAPLKKEEMPPFQKDSEKLLRWLKDFAAAGKEKISSLTSRDLDSERDRWQQKK
jgi:murein DD-endopeptidase MepM/ murein hydrolase activator NlpD